MPRVQPGHGRSGGKVKKAEKKRELAAAAAEARPSTRATAPPSPQGAATNDRDLEQVSAAAAQPANRKRVRFEPNPPTCTGMRRTLPLSTGWTWGGEWSYPADHFREAVSQNLRDWGQNSGMFGEKQVWHALRAHLWALRVAEHVAGGAMELEQKDDVFWSSSYTQGNMFFNAYALGTVQTDPRYVEAARQIAEQGGPRRV